MDISIEINKKVGRPKKENGVKFDKKTYMREYMKLYKQKNKEKQLARRNTSYCLSKFDIEESFVKKYGIYTAQMHKTFDAIKKINQECPVFIEDIDKYIKEIKKEKQLDLSGNKGLTESE